jgi:hypothetical protein
MFQKCLHDRNFFKNIVLETGERERAVLPSFQRGGEGGGSLGGRRAR